MRGEAQSATQVIELTPPGRAAVAVLVVSGPEALRAVEACFAPTRAGSLADAPLGRIVVGRWGGADGEELVVCRRSDACIEVHSHGGVAAVRSVVDSLVALGCRPVRWQDWLQTVVADPIRAAARLALAEAPTAWAAAVLIDQHEGALRTVIRRALDAVLAGHWSDAAEVIDAALAWRDVGRHLTVPWHVVLAGRTNVGKSSLINALAGYQRAIVCELPGTTRDVLTVTTAIDGWPVQLADTAGTGPTGDALGAASATQAAAALAAADLVVVVHDASGEEGQSAFCVGPFTAGQPRVAQKGDRPRRPAAKILHVLNKIDLVARRSELDRSAEVGASRPVLTSAITGEGVPELLAAIGRVLVPIAPAAGTAVPFTDGQIATLEAARAAVDRQDQTAFAAALGAWLAE